MFPVYFRFTWGFTVYIVHSVSLEETRRKTVVATNGRCSRGTQNMHNTVDLRKKRARRKRDWTYFCCCFFLNMFQFKTYLVYILYSTYCDMKSSFSVSFYVYIPNWGVNLKLDLRSSSARASSLIFEDSDYFFIQFDTLNATILYLRWRFFILRCVLSIWSVKVGNCVCCMFVYN